MSAGRHELREIRHAPSGLAESEYQPPAAHRGDGAPWRGLSGGQTLASLGPAAGENLLTTGGQHAFAKAMPALANKAARLIRALHGYLRPSLLAAAMSDGQQIRMCFPMLRNAAAPGQSPAEREFLRNPGSYSWRAPASQRGWRRHSERRLRPGRQRGSAPQS